MSGAQNAFDASGAGVCASADDYAAVLGIVRASATSFYWAMRFLPREKRDAMYAVYAFCREVDDIADGEATTEAKRTALQAWRGEIARLYAGRPSRAVTRALRGPVETYDLEQDAFLAIIDGMEMDAEGPIVAPDWATLELYCARVAGAVGLLSVRIFGLKGEAGRKLSEALGRALQLTNILRDLHEDAEIGRLYLPREALDDAGIETRAPLAVIAHPNLRVAARAVGVRAHASYKESQAIMAACASDAVRPARMMMEVYRPVLDRLEREDYASVGLARGKSGPLEKIRKLTVALRYGLF